MDAIGRNKAWVLEFIQLPGVGQLLNINYGSFGIQHSDKLRNGTLGFMIGDYLSCAAERHLICVAFPAVAKTVISELKVLLSARGPGKYM